VYNITNEDYSIVENPNSEFHGVLIKTGIYKEAIVVYGTVSIKESPELDMATLGFTFNIQDPGDHDFDKLNESEEFKNYLGAVLQHIITDSLEWGQDNKLARIGIGNNESSTDTHTESSPQQ
jgi:hypothetical protein